MQFKKPIFILVVFAYLLPTFAWAAYPAEVARTGQTICYDVSGNVITCAGTGQDGDWLAGVPWPDPRFVDNGDDTVLDNLTGLVWTKNANLLGTVDADNDTDGDTGEGAVTWQHSLDYIKKLNRENYLGYNDWRLPNVNELESLVNAELYMALPLNAPFTNVEGTYWSSTSFAELTNYAWFVGMNFGYAGDVFVKNKAGSFGWYVWPVRSGQCGSLGDSVMCLPKTGQTSCYDSAGTVINCTGTGQDGELRKGVDWPDPRFTVQSDNQSVTDNVTGLMWARNANLMVTRDPAFDIDGTANDGAVLWQQALDYIKKLNSEQYLNHTDWRLPNKRELRSLADYEIYNPALPSSHPFTNMSSCYWSSTSRASITDPGAWGVCMDSSIVGLSYKTSGYYYVWPVRAGQVGNPTISSTTTAPSTTTSVIATTTTTAGGGSTTTTTSGGATTTTSIASGSTTTTSIGGETTTTTTTGGGNPCPAKQVLGGDNPNLENLRDFRDSTLAQSAIGRKVIQIYYYNADSINAALEQSPALRAVARRVLEAIAPMVGKK